MTPCEYLFQYHNLCENDFRQGLHLQVNITNYISGWESTNQKEYEAVGGVIASKYYKVPSVYSLPDTFVIQGEPKMDPAEQFYKGSLRRAYEGRASPDEIGDAVRLALLAGKCTPTTARDYALKWFGIDCNSLVGNYLGISPSTAIIAYARGYGQWANLFGATPDVYVTKDRLPLPPVKKIADIQQGTVLITYGDPDKKGSHWRHIALVESFQMAPAGGLLSLAEWGQQGGYEKHVVRNALVQVRDDLTCPELPGVKLIGYCPDPNKPLPMRLFFDSSSLDDLDSRGWDVGGQLGV